MDDEKLNYVAINLKEYIDHWFDGYLAGHGGIFTWAQSCYDICERFGDNDLVDIVKKFNRLEQITDVETYQRRFVKLKCLMVIINPTLKEPHFVLCFIGGLKPDILPLIQFARPRALLVAYKCVKLLERSFTALYKQIDKQWSAKTYTKHTQSTQTTYKSTNPRNLTYQKNSPVVNTRNLN